MYQTRTCNPSGCDSESQCVADSSCSGPGTCGCRGYCSGDRCYVIERDFNNCAPGFLPSCILGDDPTILCPGGATHCPYQFPVIGCECVSGSTCKYTGESCSSDSDCCQASKQGDYCSSGHCCPKGFAWDPSWGICREQTSCYNNPCPYKPPNDSGYQSQWWSETACIPHPPKNNEACCYAGPKYGYDAWYEYQAIEVY
ncbi:MAG: hypothetical protein QXD48_03820 [Candidatus Aenigmatarchaeota archaeon]